MKLQARNALLALANSQKQKEDVEGIELPPEVANASEDGVLFNFTRKIEL